MSDTAINRNSSIKSTNLSGEELPKSGQAVCEVNETKASGACLEYPIKGTFSLVQGNNEQDATSDPESD